MHIHKAVKVALLPVFLPYVLPFTCSGTGIATDDSNRDLLGSLDECFCETDRFII